MTGRTWRGLRALAVGGVAALALGAGQAHEMTLAEMTVREMPSGQLLWAWGVPAAGRPIAAELTVRWPEGCTEREGGLLDCGSRGLDGTVTVDGLGRSYSAAILNVRWKTGDLRGYTMTSRTPSVRLHGGPEDTRDLREVATAYVILGIEHILTGWDHLLFVLSLLFLVGFRRRLVATVTSFTLAHSLTLAASALGAISLRSPPVEASIALSILLVAVEALRRGDTWTRRWPPLVAFLFGLVHGLGFAGALAEIGLPPRHTTVALLTFNVGVEAGQLLVIAAAGLGLWLVRRLAAARPAILEPLRVACLYGIGGTAAFWTLDRLAAFA